jgi:hypothetical protein
MEFVAPGGVRIATVEARPGLYPGTDFVNAFLTLSVDKYLTSDECTQFPDRNEHLQKFYSKKINGVRFRGIDDSGAGMSHQVSAQYYHAYSGGECIELGYGLATAGYGAVEGLKPAPYHSIDAGLEAILDSVKIRQPKTRVFESSPSIRSFTAVPLDKAGYRYRIEWAIEGARPEDSALSASCKPDVSIELVTADSADHPTFACDVLQPLQSLRGSVDLAFNYSGGPGEAESIRLFVAGQRSVSRELTIALTLLPHVVALTSYGRMQSIDLSDPRAAIRIGAGLPVLIHGPAFDGRDTVLIDGVNVPADFVDGRTLSFTAPTSLPLGEHELFVVNGRGSSDPVSVYLEHPQPRFALVRGKPTIVCEGGSTIVPGHLVRVQAIDLLPTNAVWIGTVKVSGMPIGGTDGQFYLSFAAPASLVPGEYPLYFTNDLGKSDVVIVTVEAP